MPKNDSYISTKANLLATLDVGMGGRAAEEIFFGNENITTGCGSDLKSTTNIAYKMGFLYSMLDKLTVSNNLQFISEKTKLENENKILSTDPL